MIKNPPKTKDQGMNEFLYSLFLLAKLTPTFNQAQSAADYTALKEDHYIGITSTASARTVTLPALASIPDNKQFIVKDESGGAATHNITIDGNGTETIDGATTKVINSNYGSVRIIKSGNAWFTW